MEIKTGDHKNWWSEISKEEQTSIEKGIESANAGKLTSRSQVNTIYEKGLYGFMA
jgi:hypothetical protein